MDFEDIYELINNHGIKTKNLICTQVLENKDTEAIAALFDILKLNSEKLSSPALETLRQIFKSNDSLFDSFEKDRLLL